MPLAGNFALGPPSAWAGLSQSRTVHGLRLSLPPSSSDSDFYGSPTHVSGDSSSYSCSAPPFVTPDIFFCSSPMGQTSFGHLLPGGFSDRPEVLPAKCNTDPRPVVGWSPAPSELLRASLTKSAINGIPLVVGNHPRWKYLHYKISNATNHHPSPPGAPGGECFLEHHHVQSHGS